MGLRARLIAAFLFVVVLLGGATIYTGGAMVDSTVRREAQANTEANLRSARTYVEQRLLALQQVLESLARRAAPQAVLSDGASPEARVTLERERLHYGFDALSLCDAAGRVVLRTRHPYSTEGNRALDPLVERALKGEAGRGIAILHADELALEGSDLPRQAYLPLVETPRAKPRPDSVETRGLMLWAAAPVPGPAGGAPLGALYGGILLNRNWPLVDDIRATVFGDESYHGKALGTVTIFLWDARIATNVTTEAGNRAIGTRVSAEVYDRVLESGQPWLDRAFVVRDWYLTAYEPIRDPRGQTIGILYVGVLEQKYADLKRQILRGFVTPVGIALAVAVVLSLVLARTIARPVGELLAASRHLASGDNDYRPRSLKTSPELAELTDAYVQMADAIRQRDLDLRRQNRELESANERLAQLNRSYMEMLGFVTHELKNPLNSVIFSAAALRDGYLGPLDDKQKQAADRIVRNAKYLEEMIANYLSLSRIEKGEMAAKFQPTDLRADVVEPILGQVRAQFDEAQMHVETRVPEGLRLDADPGLLRIVLDNLLTNAAKYGRQGGRVEIIAEAADDAVQLAVTNEGEGIQPENLPKLFGKFVRLDQPATKARKGTGLGLFVCREIIEKHRGRIWAESQPGQWARFTFTVPRQQPEPAAE